MPTVPLLASVADLSASVTAGGASQLVPSGVVMAFAGATAPTGWLLCAGALISRTTYADLFAAIGTAHGSGDGSTTFALPNYAGRFLRGRANGSANDPDRSLRTAAATGGNTGDAVGSVQSFATSISSGTTNKSTTGLGASTSGLDGLHSHTSSTTSIQLSGSNAGNVSSASAGSGTGGVTAFTTSVPNTGSTHGHTITVAGDNESRPLNAYVNYIIKI